MFKFSGLKQIHVVITNRCQASCPMCPRTIHSGIENPALKINDWSLDDFKTIINSEVLAQISVITLCGSFGDPLMNKDIVDICKYLKKEKPGIFVSIHTNGSMRTTEWWAEFVNALPVNHTVVFALDGFSDTHSLYRVGTVWEKIIANANAFITAGGNANWMFIKFKHNQHQVERAEQLSKEMGFKKFTVKNTRRFETSKFPVVDRNSNITHYLEQPTDVSIKLVDRRDLDNYQEWQQKTNINCYSIQQSEVYIDANYTVMPCCLLAAFIYTNYDETILKKNNLYHEHSVIPFGNKIQKQVYKIIDELGGFSNINATKQSVKDIIDNPTWQTMWQNKWDNGESIGCIVLCSNNSPYISVEEQWVKGKGPADV